MLFGIRRLFRGSPRLYLGYITMTGRRNPDIIPSDQADLFVTSFGRSGNTFCLHLIRRCFPRLKTVSHGHMPALLRLAARRRVPTVVTVRDPLEVAASSVVKFQVRGPRQRRKYVHRRMGPG